MDIVQETDRKTLKQLGLKNASDINPKERETAAGLRLKKIMRRADDNKDSLVLVQELRKKIREAVRNKSSEEVGQNLFDPKLLDAFRAALARSGAENRKPILDLKAKRSLLQKGKVRENLTKKIYGIGGKRKRGWTRECDVEFWKHRCLKASKPEKIQALKSVLDVLRDDSNHMKKIPGDGREAKGSILSRLYLADTSVFPRKNDIKPVSALNAVSTPEQKRESGSTERASKLQPNNQPDINLQKYNTLSEVIVPPSDIKETKGVKSEAVSSDAQLKRHPKGAPPLGKDLASKSDSIKGDRRKWALELLARKTAASGKNMQEKEEDNLILKGNYPLLVNFNCFSFWNEINLICKKKEEDNFIISSWCFCNEIMFLYFNNSTGSTAKRYASSFGSKPSQQNPHISQAGKLPFTSTATNLLFKMDSFYV